MNSNDMALIEAMRTGNTGMLKYLGTSGERSAADRMASALDVDSATGLPAGPAGDGMVEMVFQANPACCPECSSIDGSTVMTVPESVADSYVGRTPPGSHENCKCWLVRKESWAPGGGVGMGSAVAGGGV